MWDQDLLLKKAEDFLDNFLFLRLLNPIVNQEASQNLQASTQISAHKQKGHATCNL